MTPQNDDTPSYIRIEGCPTPITQPILFDLMDRFESKTISGDYQNPEKMSLTLTEDEVTGEALDYCNVMTARTSDGYFASKNIIIDQDGVNSSSTLALYSPAFTKIAEYDFLDLTRLRCAVLACVAIADKTSKQKGLVPSVAFVGLGRINKLIMKCLNLIYGSKGWSCYLYARHGHLSDSVTVEDIRHGIMRSGLPVKCYSTYKTLLHEGNQLDFVVTSTSANYKADRIFESHIPVDSKVSFITFDTGYIVDRSIRNSLVHYCDSVSQAIHMAQGNDEFPHDNYKQDWAKGGPQKCMPTPFKTLLEFPTSPSASFSYRFDPYVLTLTGMALYDLILAKQIWLQSE